nr:hypothetical protein CCYA8123_063 [Cyanidiococcus yangmingshanensis]
MMKPPMSSIIGKTTPSYWLLLAWSTIRHYDALWASHMHDLPIDLIWSLIRHYPYSIVPFYGTGTYRQYLFLSTWFVYYHAFCGQHHGCNRNGIL